VESTGGSRWAQTAFVSQRRLPPVAQAWSFGMDQYSWLFVHLSRATDTQEPMFTSSVKAQEASGPKGLLGLFGKTYALAITVIIDDMHPLKQEMRIINEHYINWLKRRGKGCDELILAFTAPPNSADTILTHCRRLLMQDVGGEKTLAAMDITVLVVDAETEEHKEYKLKWEPKVPATAPVRENDRPEEPFILGVRDPSLPGKEVLLFMDEDAELAAAVEEARRRIPEFKALLDCPQAGVTVRVPWVYGDIHDVYEASLVGRNGDELEVEFTPNYAPGPIRKTYRMGEILDWTVHHTNGETSGGFTTPAMLQKARKP